MNRRADKYLVRSDGTLIDMKEMFDFTAKQVTDSIAWELQNELGISKTLAKKAVINALIYNCVIEEVKGQALWLLGMDE